MGGRVPWWTQWPHVWPWEGWALSGCTLPVTLHMMKTSNHTIPDQSSPGSKQGLHQAKSQRAMENREKWRKLVVKSSMVPWGPLWFKGLMMMKMMITESVWISLSSAADVVVCKRSSTQLSQSNLNVSYQYWIVIFSASEQLPWYFDLFLFFHSDMTSVMISFTSFPLHLVLFI